jgi:excisionase family DNA binding protein
MKKQQFLTIPQAAKLLGISRIAVYKKVKSGQIQAQKIGRNYLIQQDVIRGGRSRPLSTKEKQRIDSTIRRVIKEYGETLRLLGKE